MRSTRSDNKIVGDGVHDDTASIQAALDSGVSTVYLPPPKHYLISGTLRIHSHQTLLMDRYTVIRLAPQSDCLMVTNSDHVKGNQNIALLGGVWDMDNTAQSASPWAAISARGGETTPYDPERYLGILMRFVNVENFTMRSITLRNPVLFGTQFARLKNFTIDDIAFDYRDARANNDGIHLDGGCRLGRISNLKGTTHDDLVALNADDGVFESPCFGPIERVGWVFRNPPSFGIRFDSGNGGFQKTHSTGYRLYCRPPL